MGRKELSHMIVDRSPPPDRGSLGDPGPDPWNDDQRRGPPWPNDPGFPIGAGPRPAPGYGSRDPGPGYRMYQEGDHPDRSSDKPDRVTPAVNSNVTMGFAIASPLVIGIIIIAILYKLWPKPLYAMQACLASFRTTNSAHSETNIESRSEMKATPRRFSAYARTQLDQISIQSANVQLSDEVLGRGAYGIVTKGYASGLLGYPPQTIVAVKTLLQPNDQKQKISFLKEIETMMAIGRHLNIVNLLGTVMKGAPMIILEYCTKGSLKRFLKKQRLDHFYNHVDIDGHLLAFNEQEFKLKENLFVSNVKTVFGKDHNAVPQPLSTRDLVSFSYQVSRGTEYLASNHIIHRDIAARNVLITERNVVKLSDFGMAKQWSPEQYVHENTFENPMPVKWMAPESILKKTFSQKSDVWAFGVLLYEIFTFGEDPYPDFVVQGQVMDFVAKLADGLRLTRSIYFPVEIFNKVAVNCWELDPEKRPTFSHIRQCLEDFIPLTRQAEYLEMNHGYEMFNQTFGIANNNAYVYLNYENISTLEQ